GPAEEAGRAARRRGRVRDGLRARQEQRRDEREPARRGHDEERRAQIAARREKTTERRTEHAAGGARGRQDAVEEREARAFRDARDVQLRCDEIHAAAKTGEPAEGDERAGTLCAGDEHVRGGVDRRSAADESPRTVAVEKEAGSELR